MESAFDFVDLPDIASLIYCFVVEVIQIFVAGITWFFWDWIRNIAHV